MRVLVIANGIPPSRQTALNAAERQDLVIAVDGAIHTTQRLGLMPDLLVGDMDSAGDAASWPNLPGMRVVTTPDQDRADLEKAIELAIEYGASEITVLGATGGRLDHTLANIALMMQSVVPLSFVDDYGNLRVLCAGGGPAAASLPTVIGDTVSLVTFEHNTIVSISGVRWPLERFNLLPGTLGVSNVAEALTVEVTVFTGTVFVAHLRKLALS